jgi:hypothetical protein
MLSSRPTPVLLTQKNPFSEKARACVLEQKTSSDVLAESNSVLGEKDKLGCPTPPALTQKNPFLRAFARSSLAPFAPLPFFQGGPAK